jgi:hypothetical protein
MALIQPTGRPPAAEDEPNQPVRVTTTRGREAISSHEPGSPTHWDTACLQIRGTALVCKASVDRWFTRRPWPPGGMTFNRRSAVR